MDKHVGGLTSGKSGVFSMQNCLLALLHIWNWFSENSIVLVPSSVMPKYLFSVVPCHKLLIAQSIVSSPTYQPVCRCLIIKFSTQVVTAVTNHS